MFEIRWNKHPKFSRCKPEYKEITMNLTSAAIQILPMNADNNEVIRVVDEAIAFIKSFGLHTVVGPFETTVEGDYDTIMKIIT